MGLLSSLFNSDKIIETATKGAYNGVDMILFTDEEKSLTEQKILDWRLKYLQATSAQNLSRRVIAFGVVAIWMFLIVLISGLYVFGFDTKATFIFELLKEVVLQPFNIILGFYFLAHIAGKFSNK